MKRKILCFGSHPDDIELGCGGTVAQRVMQGDEVVFAILTSGEMGGSAGIREKEAVAAAAVLGVSEVRFLRFSDGLTTITFEMKTQLINLIREVRPDTVFTHSSSDSFPDHRLFHQLTMAAITGASGPWYPQCDGTPHTVRQIYGYEVWHPIPEFQLAVDISPFMERKLSALAKHESQLADVAYDRAAQGLGTYRGVMTFSGEYAEVFEVIKAGEL